MDQNEFNERASRLEEVGKVIEKLPIEIRLEAFGLIKSYIAPKHSGAGKSEETGDDPDIDSADGESLFTKFDHDKPSGNVRLITAHLFQERGTEVFTVDEIKSIADNVGITVPTRIDMTLKGATEDGKRLYADVAPGKFKITVNGESYLKATYAVKKGKKKEVTE